jgi:hypothetical protein
MAILHSATWLKAWRQQHAIGIGLGIMGLIVMVFGALALAYSIPAHKESRTGRVEKVVTVVGAKQRPYDFAIVVVSGESQPRSVGVYRGSGCLPGDLIDLTLVQGIIGPKYFKAAPFCHPHSGRNG